MSYWQNYKKFFVSFAKVHVRRRRRRRRTTGPINYLPKLDVPAYDVLRAFELMHQGKMNGYFCQGFNPLLSFPNRGKIQAALSKLKFLVIMDPLQTETARFWEDHGEHNVAKPEEIKTAVFELPTTCFAEDEGSLVNSGRWLQWHWAGGTPPGEAKSDVWIMAQLYKRLKALYQKEGGQVPRCRSSTCTGPTRTRTIRTPAEIAKEINGYVVADVPDPADATKLRAAERQAGRRASPHCATTARPRAAAGSTPAASTRPATTWRAATRAIPDDTGRLSQVGVLLAGQSPHPLQSRLRRSAGQGLGSQAQADRVGRVEVGRLRRARHRARRAKPDVVQPFIMNPEGTARLWVRGMMKDGPFPVHYEPFESPVANVLWPKIRGNPAARVFKGDMEVFGDAKEFPYAATTYRLTEHFHFWTKHVQVNAMLQPEFFVEISEQLAKEKGIKKGGWVRVWSKRGSVKAKAVVTKRIKPMTDRRQDRARGRHPAALGLHRRGAQGLRPELADAVTWATPTSRRRNTRRSWWTSSPSPARWHREERNHGNVSAV